MLLTPPRWIPLTNEAAMKRGVVTPGAGPGSALSMNRILSACGSATKTPPPAAAATPRGSQVLAVRAGPPSPEKLPRPVPARVTIVPSGRTRRIWFTLATRKPPSGVAATAAGRGTAAAVAGPPSPDGTMAPLPATVEIVPSGADPPDAVAVGDEEALRPPSTPRPSAATAAPPSPDRRRRRTRALRSPPPRSRRPRDRRGGRGSRSPAPPARPRRPRPRRRPERSSSRAC